MYINLVISCTVLGLNRVAHTWNLTSEVERVFSLSLYIYIYIYIHTHIHKDMKENKKKTPSRNCFDIGCTKMVPNDASRYSLSLPMNLTFVYTKMGDIFKY